MKRVLLAGLAMMSLAPPVTGAEWAAISFDEDSLVTCLPDAAFPLTTHAYIVVADIMAPSLGGWEATLSWTDSLQVFPDSLLGTAPTNTGTFPDYMVRLGERAPRAGIIPLARLRVVATGSGEIGLLPFPAPSLPEAQGPVYAEGLDASLLHELPTPSGPDGVVGSQGCPSPPDSLVGAFVGGPSIIMEDPDAPHSRFRQRFIPPGWTAGLLRSRLEASDVVLMGTILDKSLARGWLDGLPSGLLCLRVSVDRDLFGASRAEMDLAIAGYDIPGFIEYHRTDRVPDPALLEAGSQVFIGASLREEMLLATPYTVCPMREGRFLVGPYFEYPDAAAVIEDFARRAHIPAQLRAADAIAVATIDEPRSPPAMLSDVPNLRGGSVTLRLDRAIRRALGPAGRYAILLADSLGTMAPMAGPKSVFLLKDGRLHSRTGFDYGIPVRLSPGG